jgi:hypothetical protein
LKGTYISSDNAIVVVTIIIFNLRKLRASFLVH